MIHAYIGTFTRPGKSEGIYVCTLDPATGDLSQRQTISLADPSFLTVSPTRRRLYAASHGRQFEGHAGGAVVAFSIDPGTGRLARLNHRIVPPHPTYVRLDRSESFVLAASGLGGAVSVLPLEADGRLAEPSAIVRHEGSPIVPQGQDPEYQGWPKTIPAGSPMPHSIAPDPANRFVLVPDLGLNRVFVYRFDAERGTLAPNQPPWTEGSPLGDRPILPEKTPWVSPAGAGPRHLAFHPTGRTVYVVNEHGSLVSVFDYDAATGTLRNAQDITTLPDGFRDFSIPADIQVHPSGRFLYASNRGHDSIAMYAVDDSTRQLRSIGFEPTRGEHPRNLAITPDGRLLLAANQDTDTIVAFAIDQATGTLRATGSVTSIPTPTCIAFLPEG